MSPPVLKINEAFKGWVSGHSTRMLVPCAGLVSRSRSRAAVGDDAASLRHSEAPEEVRRRTHSDDSDSMCRA